MYLPTYSDPFDFSPGKKEAGGNPDAADHAKFCFAFQGAMPLPVRDSPRCGCLAIPQSPQTRSSSLGPTWSPAGAAAALLTQPSRSTDPPPPKSLRLSLPKMTAFRPKAPLCLGSYVGWQNGAAGGAWPLSQSTGAIKTILQNGMKEERVENKHPNKQPQHLSRPPGRAGIPAPYHPPPTSHLRTPQKLTESKPASTGHAAAGRGAAVPMVDGGSG